LAGVDSIPGIVLVEDLFTSWRKIFVLVIGDWRSEVCRLRRPETTSERTNPPS
jgi:hypothetical protein